VLFAIFSQFGIAFIDVVVDSLIVQSSRSKSVSTATHYQTLTLIAASIGIILTTLVGGYMIEKTGSQEAFFLLSFLPILIMIITCFTYEEPTNMKLEWDTVRSQLILLKNAFQSPSVWKPCLIIFLMFSSPNADQGFFYFITNNLGIEPSFIGILTAVIGAGGIISAITFNMFLSNFQFKPIFVIFGLASAIFGLLPLLLLLRINFSWGISDKAFLISTQFISSLFDNVLLLLILVYAARVCPKNIEGTLFAVIMGILNFAYLISNYLGALILHGLGITETSFENLWIAIVISKVLFIIPIFFIKFIPDNLEASNDDDNEYSLENFNPREAGFVEMDKD